MIDTNVLVEVITPIITAIVSGWGGWFFARKKYDSEVDNNLIENMQNSLDFYMKLSDDNSKRLEAVLKNNEELNSEVKELRKQVFELTMNICLDLSCANRIRELKKKRKTEDQK